MGVVNIGRSTVAELIARAQGMNDYNSTGISTAALFIDAFNAALKDLVEDINLNATFTINYVSGTREYDLPEDFFEMLELYDDNFTTLVPKRRTYNQIVPYYNGWNQGYFILNKGANYVIDLFEYTSNQTFTGLYTRYPEILSVANVSTQKPEVPTIGEEALIYYAISRSLRNNNQAGMAAEMERKYEFERRKIRDSAQRAALGGF